MKKSRTLNSKPRNRSVLATRRRALRKQTSGNQSNRNSAYRMSLLKETEAEKQTESVCLWPR